MNRRELLLAFLATPLAAAGAAQTLAGLAVSDGVRITVTPIGEGWERVVILMPWELVRRHTANGSWEYIKRPQAAGLYAEFLVADDGADLRVEFIYLPAGMELSQKAPAIFPYRENLAAWAVTRG